MGRRVDYVIHHCTASPQTQTVGSIENYWKNVLGWKTPGYHYMIKPDGEAVNLLSIEKISNGVAGFNSHSINISYIGGVEVFQKKNAKGQPVNVIGKPIDNRTPDQKKTMMELTIKFNEMFPEAVIQGHRDFSVDKNRDGLITPDEWMKSCPSYSVKSWLKEMNFKTAMPFKLFHTTTSVNIREGAGTNFKAITSALAKGTELKKLAQADGWTYVELYKTSIVGWVKSEYIS